MTVDKRLSAEQLATLAPGDPVTVEFPRDFRRPKHVAGTIVRIVGPQTVVSCRSDRGVPCVHHFDRRGTGSPGATVREHEWGRGRHVPTVAPERVGPVPHERVGTTEDPAPDGP